MADKKRADELMRKFQAGEVLSASDMLDLSAYFREQQKALEDKAGEGKKKVMDGVMNPVRDLLKANIQGLSEEEFNLLPPSINLNAVYKKSASGVGSFEITVTTGRFKVDTPAKSSVPEVKNAEL